MSHFEEASRRLQFVQQEIQHRPDEPVLDERVDLQVALVEAVLAVAEELHVMNVASGAAEP